MVSMAGLAFVHHGVTSHYEAQQYRNARNFFEQQGGTQFLEDCEQIAANNELARLFLANLWYFYGQLFNSVTAIKKADKEWSQLEMEETAVGQWAAIMRAEARVSDRVA